MIAKSPILAMTRIVAETVLKQLRKTNSPNDEPNDALETLSFEYDIPRQTKLNRKIDLCGYISPEGDYYKLEHCEHEKFVIGFVKTHFEKELSKMEPSFFWKMPKGMFREEYFLMKELGFIKISSFEESIDEMYMLFYKDLTSKQVDFVFPK